MRKRRRRVRLWHVLTFLGTLFAGTGIEASRWIWGVASAKVEQHLRAEGDRAQSAVEFRRLTNERLFALEVETCGLSGRRWIRGDCIGGP